MPFSFKHDLRFSKVEYLESSIVPLSERFDLLHCRVSLFSSAVWKACKVCPQWYATTTTDSLWTIWYSRNWPCIPSIPKVIFMKDFSLTWAGAALLTCLWQCMCRQNKFISKIPSLNTNRFFCEICRKTDISNANVFAYLEIVFTSASSSLFCSDQQPWPNSGYSWGGLPASTTP